MTIMRSISFSRATASAIAISSALLAETAPGAGAAVAMGLVLSFFFDFDFYVRLVDVDGGERRGRRDQPVGHQQFRVADSGERDDGFAKALHVDPHILAVHADQVARQLLAPLERLVRMDPRLVALPV